MATLNRAILGERRFHLARSNRRGERVAVCGYSAYPTYRDSMNVPLVRAEKVNGSESRCVRCFRG